MGLARAERTITARVGGPTGRRSWEGGLGLVVAVFSHHTHLAVGVHTHMVVLNRAQCRDGRWRALEGRDLRIQEFLLSLVADQTLARLLPGSVVTRLAEGTL